MIGFYAAVAALQVVASAAPPPPSPPTCDPAMRVRALPSGSAEIVQLHSLDPKLAPLLDSLVRLWTPETFVIDEPVGRRLDSLSAYRLQEVNRLWSHDSARLVRAFTTMIVDNNAYGLYLAEQASFHYHRLWGRELPLLANTINDWSYERSVTTLQALKPPLSDAAQAVVLGMGCDAAWQLQAVQKDPALLRAYLTEHVIYWPRGATMVVNYVRPLLAGPYLQALDEAMAGMGDLF